MENLPRDFGGRKGEKNQGFFTHDKPNEQFDYEPHIAEQLDVEKRFVCCRFRKPIKQ